MGRLTLLNGIQIPGKTRKIRGVNFPFLAPRRARPGPDPRQPRLVILTPIKDIEEQARPYFERLLRLTFPHANISIGLLESDSRDDTYAAFTREAARARADFRAVDLWQKPFHYHIPPGLQRWEPDLQAGRRAVLARSRNHLLFRALGDAGWAMWLDADVIDFPADIVERLLAFGKDIVHPHCVLVPGGRTFDGNGWSDHGRKFLQDHRGGPDLVELTAVGGTLLFVRADRHRDGLIFPCFPYGAGSPHGRCPEGGTSTQGEIETEGFGLLAADMNLTCWGAPHLEIIHRNA